MRLLFNLRINREHNNWTLTAKESVILPIGLHGVKTESLKDRTIRRLKTLVVELEKKPR